MGQIRTTEDIEHAFDPEPLRSALREMPPCDDRDILLNNLQYETFPYLISLDSYNQLLSAARLPALSLNEGEAAVYMDHEWAAGERTELLNRILETEPETMLDQAPLRLTGTVQTTNLITDRSITLSFALILPDEAFDFYTQGEYEVYLNGILAENSTKHTSLMSDISDMNQRLGKTGLTYESYLQNMGRQLFYMVSASYITIYLAIIFLIIANTVIGVQYLMGQRRSNRRYRTLVRLGAAYSVLCTSSRKQINWYFGIPAAAAAFSSLFGVRALFTGILPSAARNNVSEMLVISAAMIFALCMVELIYITAVKRSSDRYLLTLMVPEREE